MMKRITTVLPILFLLQATQPIDGAQMYYDPDPLRHPGGCYDEDFGHFKYGEDRSWEECGIANCESDGGILLTTCGSISLDVGCIIVPMNISKPFPKCCPALLCNSKISTRISTSSTTPKTTKKTKNNILQMCWDPCGGYYEDFECNLGDDEDC